MRVLLFLLLCIMFLISCGNKEINKKEDCVIESRTSESGEARNLQSSVEDVPHIFHGWTSEMACAELNEEGDVVSWSEWEPEIVKYALYLDQGIISIFTDSTQLHKIDEYLGKEVMENAVCYNIMVSDYGEFGGYIKFCYQNNGIVQLYIDYPKMMVAYALKSFMPKEELERRLEKFYIKL